MIGIVTDAASALGQIACGGFLGETGYANREVIDNFGRALTVQRDQSPVRTETNDSERLVLADDGEVEHFLIEVDGTLQVRNLNADMVDVRGLEIDIVLGSSGRRSGGCHHRETSNQLPTAEGALLELAHKIGNDRFHDDSFLFGGKFRLHIIEHAAVFAPYVYHVLKANWTSANPTCEIPKEVYPAKRRVHGYTARWTFRVHWWCDVPGAFSYAGLRKVWDNLSDAK